MSGFPLTDDLPRPRALGLPARRLSRRQQRIIVVSTLRLGAGIMLAIPLTHATVAGPFGPWVLVWLLGSAICAIVGSSLRVGSRLSPRTGWVGRSVEPVLAAVDALAFVTVALTSLGQNGYGPVAVLGLVLLAQAPLTWGWRGVVLVVAPLTAVALWNPSPAVPSSSVQLALVAVIAGAAALGLWLRQLLLSQRAIAEHTRATLAVVFDHSPTPAGILCVTGRFLRANAAMSALCGCGADRLSGQRLIDLVHPDDAMVLERVMVSVLRDEAPAGTPGQTMETRLMGPADERWVRLVVGFVPASLGFPAQLVVQAEDVQERRAATARLEHEATHDSLTGLPNRRAVHRELERLTAGPPPDQGLGTTDGTARTGALVLIDLDGFKAVNDQMGHAAGDEVLVLAARRIEGCLEVGEMAARLAGDELVVIADAVDGDEGARALGRRVLSALVGTVRVDAGPVDLQASAGVARLHDDDGPSSVLRRADVALYRAKRAGGGRLELTVTPPRPARTRVTSR